MSHHVSYQRKKKKGFIQYVATKCKCRRAVLHRAVLVERQEERIVRRFTVGRDFFNNNLEMLLGTKVVSPQKLNLLI